MSAARGRRLVIVAVLGTLVAVAAGVAFWVYSRPPSILLITVDTLRPDRLGAYGHPTNRTPAIDRLAEEGMRFDRAFCDVPWTTGSMASVMTGQYSGRHGLQLATERLAPEAVTLAELLHARGFQTGAVVGSFPLDSVYGLDQGFETYDDEFDSPMILLNGHTTEHVPSQAPDVPGSPDQKAQFRTDKFQNDAYRSDSSVTDAAIRWLDTIRDGRPFFLWVHYFGPHELLHGDENFVEQEPRMIDAYDPAVEVSDEAVGRLIDHVRDLEILDHTVVILHSDHGQNLGEQGSFGHGIRLDEVTTRIPMIVRYPRSVPAGLKRVDVAHNTDIAPTVLAAIGAPTAGFSGRSLLPTREDPRGAYVPAEEQIVYYETLATTFFHIPLLVPKYWIVLGPVERTGVRTDKWRFVSDLVVGKCVYDKGPPLRNGFGAYNLPNGKALPEEDCKKIRQNYLYPISVLGDREIDVSREFPDVVAQMLELLAANPDRGDHSHVNFNLSPEQEEKLRSLGYLK